MVKTNIFPVQLKPRVCITLTQTGQGTVVCSNPSCVCPSRCINPTTVTITATPASGWVFSEWTGGYTGTTNPATLTLTTDITVNAVFIQLTVISELNPPPASIYNSTDPGTGQPWEEGQTNAQIANISVKNVGTIPGVINWRCYAYANQAGETMLAEGSTTSVNPGDSVSQPIIVTIPLEPSGSIQFGIKTKGETETEWPPWETGLKTIIWGAGGIDPLLIGGAVVAAIIGGVILYFLFKKK